ncbi:MAG: hypothetical protein ACOYL6_04550 [Bacteriovoracaceae bacterium]
MAKAEIQLNREHKQAYYLQFYTMIMLFLSLNIEVVMGIHRFDFVHIIKLIFWLTFYNLYFKTLYRLELYFWMFSAVVVLYMTVSLLWGILTGQSYILFYLYLTANVAMWMELYMMSSPIFFPRTSWWEYDFRFRPDLKIQVELHQGAQVESFEGRMTDIRRQAACVVLFQDLARKKKIVIRCTQENMNAEFNAVVISKREYSFGRGLTYGVKLQLKTSEEKKRFKEFHRGWNQMLKKKLQTKFKELSQHHKQKDHHHELPY